MPGTIDLTGQRFGRLEVLGRARDVAAGGHVRWACGCACGETTTVRG